ncbi:MAG: HAD family hydrolase [Caldisericia bacterium]|jgi:HAD superfamily hydrolase (TIGR01662 family)|nr:HAD family hydrolase [Caldisericia bacterium]
MKLILFDLDKTLLDINFDEFLKSYFALLIPKLVRVLKDKDPLKILQVSVDYMIYEKNGELNVDKFYKKFVELSQVDRKILKEVFLDFYINDFPKLKIYGKPREGGRETVLNLIKMGYKVVIATNSIFPEIAIMQRIEWANLSDINFSLVTTMENMHYAKPNVEYYIEILEKLNSKPEDSIMIGDDLEMDILPAKKLGIKTVHFGVDIKEIKEIINLISNN